MESKLSLKQQNAVAGETEVKDSGPTNVDFGQRGGGYNSTVDFLKCVAAMSVFVCHCYIACSESFDFNLKSNWQVFLKTPAWAGVWIFMITSGFLAGFSFFRGKYSIDRIGIKKYYTEKVKRILLPTYVVISLIYILSDTGSPITLKLLVRFITCTFQGSGAATGVGAMWYVFTLMWLYLLTPVIVKLMYRMETHNSCSIKTYGCIFCVLSVLGLGYRIIGRMAGLSWYNWIYANPIGNLDLFIGGMIIGRIKYLTENSKNRKINRHKRVAAGLLLFVLLATCSVFYYFGEIDNSRMLSVYRYVMPSFFLVNVAVMLLNSEQGIEGDQTRLKMFFRLLAKYTFFFYLWHSLVLTNIAKNIEVGNSFLRYLIVLLLGFLCSAYVAVISLKAFDYKKGGEGQ